MLGSTLNAQRLPGHQYEAGRYDTGPTGDTEFCPAARGQEGCP